MRGLRVEVPKRRSSDAYGDSESDDGGGSSSAVQSPGLWSHDEEPRGDSFELDDGEERQPMMPRQTSVSWIDEEEREHRSWPDGRFKFLEEPGCFSTVLCLVLLGNVFAVCSGWPREDARAQGAMHLLLALYVLEMVLRVLHAKRPGVPFMLLSLRRESVVTWIDIVAVSGCAILVWVLPAIGHEQESVNDGWRWFCLRSVRALSSAFSWALTLPQVKIATSKFGAGSLDWVESAWWHSRVGYVIIFNAVVMGFETDMTSPVFKWIEEVLLCFFVLELSCRLRLRGYSFFTDLEDRNWNMLDFMIVLCGVLDQWVLEAWRVLLMREGAGDAPSEVMGLVRILRLMRILRLVRVAKSMRPLRLLALGVVRAMGSMFWVLVLTFVFLYLLGIVMTRMIGHSEGLFNGEGEGEKVPLETIMMFGTIGDSMFTLFAFMNGHEWHKVAPLLDKVTWTKPFFVIFTIYSSWALLSVMTGVVSDHIQDVRLEQKRQDDEENAEQREQLRNTLAQIFAAADAEGTGTFSRAAYMEVLNSNFQVKRLQRAVHQPVDNLRRIFDWLDIDRRGFLEFDEFLDGLYCLEDMVTGQRLLKMDSAVKLMCSAVQGGVELTGQAVEDLRQECDQYHVELLDRMSVGVQAPGCSRVDLSDCKYSAPLKTTYAKDYSLADDAQGDSPASGSSPRGGSRRVSNYRPRRGYSMDLSLAGSEAFERRATPRRPESPPSRPGRKAARGATGGWSSSMN